MNIMMKKEYYKNCFLLFIPIIMFNVIFTKYLPEKYLQNISHKIVTIENIFRLILIIFSIIMKINFNKIKGKIGLFVYVIGVIIYFTSYFIIINNHNTFLGKYFIIQLSGYWSAIIWLIGIGLIGNKLLIKIPYHYSIYLILSIIFTIVHTFHGIILLK